MSDDETLPPEMLPRAPGADVIIVCPSCQWRWVPEDERCPNCGRSVDEPGPVRSVMAFALDKLPLRTADALLAIERLAADAISGNAKAVVALKEIVQLAERGIDALKRK